MPVRTVLNLVLEHEESKRVCYDRIGSDGRMSEFSYDWTARLLKKLGFRTLEQVERCISGYDDDRLSRIATGGRLGQAARFEYMLLAGMGENYIRRHTFAGEPWHERREQDHLERFRKAGIEIRDYDPLIDQIDTQPRADRIADSEGPSEGQAEVGAAV